MFMMVDYVGEMTMKKSCMANMNCLSICVCELFFFFISMIAVHFFSVFFP